MKATGIVRRIDDLGRVVIPKEIRRTLKIREGGPSLTTLGWLDEYIGAIKKIEHRVWHRFSPGTTHHKNDTNIPASN